MHLRVLEVRREELRTWRRSRASGNNVGKQRRARGIRLVCSRCVLAERAARIQQVVQQHAVGDGAKVETIAEAEGCLAGAIGIECEADARAEVVLLTGVVGDIGGSSQRGAGAGASVGGAETVG